MTMSDEHNDELLLTRLAEAYRRIEYSNMEYDSLLAAALLKNIPPTKIAAVLGVTEAAVRLRAVRKNLYVDGTKR